MSTSLQPNDLVVLEVRPHDFVDTFCAASSMVIKRSLHHQ
jgi:hypothetical protein